MQFQSKELHLKADRLKARNGFLGRGGGFKLTKKIHAIS